MQNNKRNSVKSRNSNRRTTQDSTIYNKGYSDIDSLGVYYIDEDDNKIKDPTTYFGLRQVHQNSAIIGEKENKIEDENKYCQMQHHALDKIKKYAKYKKCNIVLNRLINTYKKTLNNKDLIEDYKDKILKFYNNKDYNTDNIEIIASSDDNENWFIAIDTKNKNYFYSLDGKNVVDEKVVNYLTRPTIEWSNINKNTKLKFGTRIAGMPKALKKHILNPKSKFNPKDYFDNKGVKHDIPKESKRAEKILCNNFVKGVKKLQQENNTEEFNKDLSYIRNNRHLNY